MPGQVDLSLILKARDEASGALQKVADVMNQVVRVGRKETTLGEQLREVGTKAKTAAVEVAKLGAKLGVIGGVAAFAFKKGFLDIGADFERMETVLTTLFSGSVAKARKALNWIKDFATRTPYEIAQVTEAFIRLRSYGMDPTNSLLETLGDTAAAMGKPMMAAVEMMADAVNGENERLTEFGIKASVQGQKIAYSYFDKQGQEMVRVVNKNRSEIREALMEIFGAKYAGGMSALAKTWVGMISNLKDAWTNFAGAVMEAGVLDVLKNELRGVLDFVLQLKANTKDSAIVKETATVIIQKLKEFKTIAAVVWPVVVQIATAANNAAQALGGWGNVINVALILMSLSAISSIVGLVFSIVPVILTIAGIIGTIGAAIGVAVFLITAITAGISPLMAIVAVIGGEFLAWVASITGIWQTLVTVATWVGRILLFALRFAGPIGIVITLVTTLATLGVMLYKNWQPFRDLVNNIASILKDLIQNRIKAVMSDLQKIGSWLGIKAEPANSVANTRPAAVAGSGFAQQSVANTVVPNLINNNILANLGATGSQQKMSLHIKLDVENKRAVVTPTGAGRNTPNVKTDIGFVR